jgi:hypothetical protein
LSNSLSADDLPATLAQSTASQLDRGLTPDQALPRERTELTHSLSPFVLVYDAGGQPLASSATLDGEPPGYPTGVLKTLSVQRESRVTWQPEPGIRLATVGLLWNGGIVVAGQSLRLTEQHIDTLGEPASSAG